jgi:hypothetical protein
VINLGTAAAHIALQRQKVKGEKPMPYVSDRQRRFFNANRSKIGGKTVDEFNQASKGMSLPEKAPSQPAEAPKKKAPWSARMANKGRKK